MNSETFGAMQLFYDILNEHWWVCSLCRVEFNGTAPIFDWRLPSDAELAGVHMDQHRKMGLGVTQYQLRDKLGNPMSFKEFAEMVRRYSDDRRNGRA